MAVGRMTAAVTRVELRADGRRVVYHRRGGKAWCHPATEPFLEDAPKGRMPCPVCR